MRPDELRLVAPRRAARSSQAIAAATHADGVLREARIFATLAAAIADLHCVFATCPRHRDMVKERDRPRQAALDIRAMTASGERPGILFGPERTGLESDEVSLADVQVSIPLNPGYSSLNLAQAVLVMGYEWWQAADADPAADPGHQQGGAGDQGRAAGFLRPARGRARSPAVSCATSAMRPTMVRNIRAMFQRAGLMSHEINTLQGILTGLTERPHAPPQPGSRATKRRRRPRPKQAAAGRPSVARGFRHRPTGRTKRSEC